MLPMFLAVVDQTIVATALPSIAASLGEVERISWIVIAYLISGTVAAPVYGYYGDLYGRRKVMFVALTVFILFFGFVTFLGFAAARWRRGDLDLLHEWGLAGNRFGTMVTWFLIGGDIYTAYTFIAVPALVYGVGAIGFFAVPNAIIVFPIVFVFAPRLWSVSRVHNYITPADFVRGRYGSHGLALAVAVTGILATMPYIALQLVGIQTAPAHYTADPDGTPGAAVP